jgi:hypothetical protein
MAAPSLNTMRPDPMVSLDPSAAATRGFYARRRRPEVAGYRVKASAVAAHKLVGVNHPGSLVGGFPIGSINQNVAGQVVPYTSPANKVFATSGKGNSAAQLAAGFENYTVTTTGDFVVAANATATIPQDTDITDATNYANAILMAYPAAHHDSNKAILFTRIAKSGTLAASGQWKVNNATSIDVCWDYNATPANSNGVPASWKLILILPAATDVVTIVDNASAGAFTSFLSPDFLFAGKTSQNGVIAVNRLLQ